jgi:septal ring factor EnvC (AmiA/AmiB activator)
VYTSSFDTLFSTTALKRWAILVRAFLSGQEVLNGGGVKGCRLSASVSRQRNVLRDFLNQKNFIIDNPSKPFLYFFLNKLRLGCVARSVQKSKSSNRDRVATAQAEATKANKGLEALKNEARAQAQTHARAHAQALEAHAEIVRKMQQDNTALKEQVFALRQDKATLESQVAHLRPLATKAVRKAASLSRETKKLMKEKESFLREKLILQVELRSVYFGVTPK